MTITGRAATLRQLALYGLAVIGLFWAASTTTSTLAGIWSRIADAVAPIPGFNNQPVPPPGVQLPPRPSQDDQLRFQLIGAVPAILAGLALWLGTWIPLQRGCGPDAGRRDRARLRRAQARDLSRRTRLRARRVAQRDGGDLEHSRALIGTPASEEFRNIQHDLGFPVVNLIVFGTVWLFHRRVVQSEAARETAVERAATIRRLYTYLIAADRPRACSR